MKFDRFAASTITLLVAAIGFNACEEKIENLPDKPAEIEITVTPSEDIVFEAEGGAVVLKIETGGNEWEITKSDWITVSPDFDKNELEVMAGPCDTQEGREGEVTVSCDSKSVSIKVTQKGIVPSLSVDKTELEFTAQGGQEIIKVEALNVKWDIEALSATWITVEKDQTKNEIIVKAEPNSQPAERNAEFSIVGEGVEPINVTISQEAAEVVDFWSRTTAARLGYSGNVKSVSQHFDWVNNNAYVMLTDLQFDNSGNLVQFDRMDGMKVSVSYDSQNRIEKIEAKSDTYDFAFLFGYETHGNYIPIFEIFEYDLDVLLPIDFRVWMPFFIKDLGSLAIRDNIEPGNNIDYRFNQVDGNMTIDLYMEDGSPFYPQYYDIEYDGIYPKRMVSEGFETGVYETDAATGMIIRQVMYSYYDIEYERNLDALNTISHAVFGVYDMKIKYNDRLDISSRESNNEDAIPSFTADYTYDEKGNWLEMNMKYKDQSTDSFIRTVSYWQ